MRLIDADEIGLTDFEIVMCNGDYKEALKMLLDKISNQPTAYDIDKVVEELNCDRCESCKFLEVCACSKCCTGCHKKAIEIVKQSGVSDDVCEVELLRWYKFLHETSCGNVFDMQNGFKYCPYCGKKIKVVG